MIDDWHRQLSHARGFMIQPFIPSKSDEERNVERFQLYRVFGQQGSVQRGESVFGGITICGVGLPWINTSVGFGFNWNG